MASHTFEPVTMDVGVTHVQATMCQKAGIERNAMHALEASG
jgi:hypothetical protein